MISIWALFVRRAPIDLEAEFDTRRFRVAIETIRKAAADIRNSPPRVRFDSVALEARTLNAGVLMDDALRKDDER